MVNVVWVSKQDTELINALDDPLLKYKNLTKKFTYWRRNSDKSNKVEIDNNSLKDSRFAERNERLKSSKKNKNIGYTSEGYFTSEVNETRSIQMVVIEILMRIKDYQTVKKLHKSVKVQLDHIFHL